MKEYFKHQTRLVEMYNDLDGFPTLVDIADAMGWRVRTVQNRAAELRAYRRRGFAAPELITSPQRSLNDNAITTLSLENVPTYTSTREAFQADTPVLCEAESSEEEQETEEEPERSAHDHASARQDFLQEELRRLISRGRYPVINPEAISVTAVVVPRYSARLGCHTNVARPPTTTTSGILMVQPVRDPRNRKYIFTGAQNDAPVHAGFWRNLQAYAAHIGAEIVVGVWTYGSQWWNEASPVARAYAPEIADHLCFGRMELGKRFAFCGETNILPTAKRPLQSMKDYLTDRSGVFACARRQLLSIPTTNPNRPATQIMTTGAVTQPKVVPRLAGNKAIRRHVIGATLVEFDADGRMFARQIGAEESGAFYDLDQRVENGRVTRGHRLRALVAADLHIAKLGTKNAKAVFGVDTEGHREEGSMLDVLRPEYLLIHDGHDQEIGNHHRADDGHFAHRMAVRGRTSMEGEISRLGNFYMDLKRDGLKIVNVESNHDLALDRWIKEGRYRKDGDNVRFGNRLEGAMLAQEAKAAVALDLEEAPPKFSLLEWALRDLFGDGLDHVEWAYDNDSYKIDEIECGHHGFRGANGSRGTVNGYADMGVKMSIGDKHSPSIVDDVYGAGAMELQHGYNRGPSGWAVTQIVQYPNGERTLITLQEGKWRA